MRDSSSERAKQTRRKKKLTNQEEVEQNLHIQIEFWR